MKISLFNHAKDANCQEQEVTWEQLEGLFDEHDTSKSDKLSVEMFSPCEFSDKYRHTISALRVHFGAIDLDGVSKEQIEFVKRKLEGTACIFYTTWSHTKEAAEREDSWCVRFLFPFSRAVEKHEWQRFWPLLNAYFNGSLDTACASIEKAYFMPSCQNLEGHFIKRESGKEFDVNQLFATPLSQLKAIKTTTEDLKALASKLIRKPSDHAKEMAKALRLGIEGKELAESGDRDNTYFKLAHVLAENFPKDSAENLASLFRASLAVATKNGSDKSTPTLFAEKIRRAAEKVKEDKNEEKKELDTAISLRIAKSFGFASGRIHPYTEIELESFARQAKVSRDFFQSRWILQHGKFFFIFHNGKYFSAQTADALVNAAKLHLSPAISAGVNCYKAGNKGELVPKSKDELMEDYGTPIFRYDIDMTADYDFYDDMTQTFTEASCPKRNLPAEYSEEIAKWLDLLGGDDKEKFLDWLSKIPDTSKPCAALYIGETPGVGKSLLGTGLARIWTTKTATTLNTVLTEFNDAIMNCPFIFADEFVPDDKKILAKIRKLIQDQEHKINRKFHDITSAKGCIRLLMAANNENMLDSDELLTTNDILGIMERMMYLPGNLATAEYLESLGGREYLNAWVTEDKIAKHVLWLSQNRILQKPSRFQVSGKDSVLHRNLKYGDKMTSAVIHWLVGYLQNPSKLDVTRTFQVRVYKGELLVTSKAFSDYWDIYATQTKAPPPFEISKALRSACDNTKKTLRVGTKNVNYWSIGRDALVAWGEMRNYISADEIDQHLAKDTDVEIGFSSIKDVKKETV